MLVAWFASDAVSRQKATHDTNWLTAFQLRYPEDLAENCSSNKVQQFLTFRDQCQLLEPASYTGTSKSIKLLVQGAGPRNKLPAYRRRLHEAPQHHASAATAAAAAH